MEQILFYCIIAIVLLEFILSKTLNWLNLNTWSLPLPKEVNDLYEPAKYKEAETYARTNYRFGLLSSVVSLTITLLFLVWGGFAWVNNWVISVSDSPILQALLFFGVLGAGSMLISLPFDIYHTFVIEARFGFNKSTPAIFIADKLKGIALGAVIGGGLLALLVWLYTFLGGYFWVAAWVTVSGFTIFFAMFYVSWIVPIFNKLTPLQDGALRQAIEAYAAKVNFPLTNIYVIDGSKRSTKANAYFSGLGRKKNIVLYDTLIQDLSIDEITAVLAHEVGHYKKKHILQSMVLSVIQLGVLFYLFGWLSQSDALAGALGATSNNFHLSLVAFSMLYSPVSMFVGVLMHVFSRKNEYEADRYARDTYNGMPLISGLKKMSVKHLSNLQPHPAYVFMNYSHPTLLQRIRNIQAA